MQTISPQDYAWFEAELETRRRQVYALIEDPRYAARFRPAHTRDAILHYLQGRGKALRPLMVLLSCGAVGGEEVRAVPAAAAVELFHTWTLVHDDIIDRDETRRGRATVHTAFTSRARADLGLAGAESAHYGATVAILAGDQQQGWAYALLAELPDRGVDPQVALQLVRDLALSVEPDLLEGELLDVQFSYQPITSLDEAQVLDMLSKKTAVLYRFAARAGALIGLDQTRPGAAEAARLTDALETFAATCGTAFQLQDDLLGITGDAARLGKPIGSDLREGKKTLIVFHALRHGTPAQVARVQAALGQATASPDTIAAATRTLEETGSLAYVRDLAQTYITRAYEALDVLPDTPYRRLLTLWARFLVAREF
jgi:geranylgeranyl diphosphate synthase type I